MTAAEEDTSETSPLLANGSGRKSSIGDEVSVVVTAGVDVEGADLERRDSVDESRAAQFQGLPEMQKKLKIILPAVAIGVSSFASVPILSTDCISGLPLSS